MNKLVTLPIVDAVPLMPTDDKAVRLASEVKDAEARARRSGVVRNLLERQKLSKNGYAALCRLDQLAGKLARSRPSTVAGLVAKANAARLLDGYGEDFTSESLRSYDRHRADYRDGDGQSLNEAHRVFHYASLRRRPFLASVGSIKGC